MRHDEVREYLAALVAGELEEPLRSTIEAHAAECADCRDWRRTQRAVASAMATAATDSAHPSSEELATWAVEPDGPTTEGLAHLESCAACREELDLACGALLEARGATGRRVRPAAPGTGRRRVRLALAAGLIGAVVAGGLLFRRAESVDSDYRLSSETLTGQRLIAAESSIRAEAVEIARGSDIVFEAGDVISLGDGFVVATGATFAASTPEGDDARSDET